MIEFDPGPPPEFCELFTCVPSYAPYRDHFWYDWGPVFYRGRLDGSARVLCVASDPGPTERIAMRTLVGDAGQRVQGFLAKIDLLCSYVCLNAFVYALYPNHSLHGTQVLKNYEHFQWRNELFTKAKSSHLQAVIAFGRHAQAAVQLSPGSADLPVFKLPHPSSRHPQQLLAAWRAAVTQLPAIVTPNLDANLTLLNYGTGFAEADYARIPHRDLPFGVPAWLGDDAWGRRAHPSHQNSMRRPHPDDGHTLIWIAPRSQDHAHESD